MVFRYHARFSTSRKKIMYYDYENKTWDHEQPNCSVDEIQDFAKAATAYIEHQRSTAIFSGPKTPTESPMSEGNRHSGPRNFSIPRSPTNQRKRSIPPTIGTDNWQVNALIGNGIQELMIKLPNSQEHRHVKS